MSAQQVAVAVARLQDDWGLSRVVCAEEEASHMFDQQQQAQQQESDAKVRLLLRAMLCSESC